MRASLATITLLLCVGCAGRSGIETRPGLDLEPHNGHWVLQETHRPSSGGFKFAARKGTMGDRVSDAFAVVLTGWAERFTLTLNDSVFRVSESEPDPPFAVPVDGDRVRLHDDRVGVGLSVSLTWSGDTPVIERSLPSGGVVLDRYELAADGTLVVTRTGRVGAVESKDSLQLVYRRSDTPTRSFASGRPQVEVSGGADKGYR